MSTDNMCIFYTFVPFYKFKMQYLYSFTKPFSIVSYAEVPILYYLCYFSHYVVYQMCFRNTYCVTDDIRYATIGQDCGSAQHGTIRRHQGRGLLTPTSYNTVQINHYHPKGGSSWNPSPPCRPKKPACAPSLQTILFSPVQATSSSFFAGCLFQP